MGMYNVTKLSVTDAIHSCWTCDKLSQAGMNNTGRHDHIRASHPLIYLLPEPKLRAELITAPYSFSKVHSIHILVEQANPTVRAELTAEYLNKLCRAFRVYEGASCLCGYLAQ